MEQHQGDHHRQGPEEDPAQLPEAAAQAVGKGHKGEQAHGDGAVEPGKNIGKQDARCCAGQDEPGKVGGEEPAPLRQLLQRKTLLGNQK